MIEWVLVLTVASTFSALGFIIIGILWLRKLRETVSVALTEAARHQVRSSQRLSDAVDQLQKQQRGHEQQLQILSQSNMQLRQGLTTVASRIDLNQSGATRGDQTVH